jgi:hypothetical protein
MSVQGARNKYAWRVRFAKHTNWGLEERASGWHQQYRETGSGLRGRGGGAALGSGLTAMQALEFSRVLMCVCVWTRFFLFKPCFECRPR